MPGDEDLERNEEAASGFVGVAVCPTGFRARYPGSKRNLGIFPTAIQAARARRDAVQADLDAVAINGEDIISSRLVKAGPKVPQYVSSNAARARRDFMAANPLQESPEEGQDCEEDDDDDDDEEEEDMEEELLGDDDLERSDKGSSGSC
jgi:hypothetical protein